MAKERMMKEVSMEQFAEMVKDAIQLHFGSTHEVLIQEMVKNNGLVLKGLMITDHKNNIMPIIYLEAYYKCFCEGAYLEAVCEDILFLYEESRRKERFDTEQILSFEAVKERICFKLVNKDLNKELLEQVPHILLQDLAVVFNIPLSGDWKALATIVVKNDFQRMWGVTTEELYSYALQNTEKLFPSQLMSIEDFFTSKLENVWMEQEEKEVDVFGCRKGILPMYVVTNSECMHGASVILYKGFLREFTEKLGEDVYIIPSSVHEVLLVPVSANMETEILKEMILHVNETEVKQEERLSDNLYYYSRESDRLEVV